MAKGRFATLVSWSFSVYIQYLKCPFSVCLDKIMRVKITEPDNPYLIHGDKVHKALDTVVTGKIKKPPKIDTPAPDTRARILSSDLSVVNDQLVQLRTLKARTEQEWAFDRQWNPVSWTDWSNAWLRIKTDACGDTKQPPTVTIVDWKTGKVHDEHKQQRSLYALGGLQLVKLGMLAGGAKDVQLTAQHVYVDTGQSATEQYTMARLEPLKREWLTRTKRMMTDTTFKTNTGPHCRYCKFAKSKGGPCPEAM